MRSKQFGGKVTKELIKEYERSSHWIKGRFRNLERTAVSVGFSKMPGIIYKQIKGRAGKEPSQPLPVIPFNKNEFLNSSKETQIIWYGHSAILMRMNGKNILIDPMLGPDTTPIAPVPTKRFSNDTIALIDDLPDIDLILITHDHYDHLDYSSIQKLKLKTKNYFVALGVKRHLVSWGVAPDLITEFDWWNSQMLGDIDIAFTPTRHFSGRGLTDMARSLWGGWAFKMTKENIWFSGDGGYGKHFKEIGERLGPFDFAFMECGQYNDDWNEIHLFPEESIQAAIDARAKKVMPVHWAGFSLSYQHRWEEPAEEFLKAAISNNISYIIPEIGQQFSKSFIKTQEWWREFQVSDS